MPDVTEPCYGWQDTWRATGRVMTRVGVFGIPVLYHEQWRFPFGDEEIAPDFRWKRGRPCYGGPMPRRVVREIEYRKSQD